MKATDSYRLINESPLRGIILYYTDIILKEVKSVKLGVVINEIQTGKTPPKSQSKYYESNDVNWFKPSDIGYGKYLIEAEEKFSSLALDEKKGTLFPKNSLLIIGIGGGVGRVSLLKEAGSSNQQITGLLFTDNIFPEWGYYYYLVREDYVKSQAKSMSFPILNQGKIKELEFKFPSKEDQIEACRFFDNCWNAYQNGDIPDIDDFKVPIELKEYALNQFKAIELDSGIKTSIQTQKQLLTQLKQAILQEAIQGKLTEEWRQQNSPPVEGCLKGGVVNSPPLEEYPKGEVVNTSHKEESIKRNSKNYFSLPYNPKLKDRAKALRKAGNLSEVLFWNEVKRKQFKGLDFDRQKIIGNYIVDFYCPNCQVVVEIDGSSHDDKQEYDAQRDAYLESLGLTVIHIPDSDIKKKLAETMNWLLEHPAFEPPRPAGTPPEEGKEPPRSSTTPPLEGGEYVEHASVLLQRIKAEKAQLIKDKKIKKEKPLPPITEDGLHAGKAGIPFDLPEGWVWCRLGEILLFSDAGKSPNCKKRPANIDEWGVLTTTAIQKRYFIEEANKVLPPAFKVNPDQQVFKDDILITRAGPLNRTGVSCKVDKINSNLILSDKTIRLKHPEDLIDPDFVVSVINSLPIRTLLIPKMTGMAESQVNISQGNIKTTPIPLPPLQEQKDIVQKVASLMEKCRALEAEITQSEQHAQLLMQAVLKEAFQPAETTVQPGEGSN